jgi:hypothetical protein
MMELVFKVFNITQLALARQLVIQLTLAHNLPRRRGGVSK